MANAERELAEDAEWKRIQQNTFTRWANEHLKQADKSISDLETDLSDGLKLISLIEVSLSAAQITKEHCGSVCGYSKKLIGNGSMW